MSLREAQSLDCLLLKRLFLSILDLYSVMYFYPI